MVDGVKPGGISGPSQAADGERRETGAPFVVNIGGGSTPQTAHLSSPPAIGFDSMLLLQAVDERQERDRQARKRGTAMIAALSDLQRAMLAAEDPALALRSLSALASDCPLAADAALAGVLRAVVLRARVELARRDRGGD